MVLVHYIGTGKLWWINENSLYAQTHSVLHGIEYTVKRYLLLNSSISAVLHAEMDALTRTTKNEISTHRATLYTTLHPCFNCARYIVQMGVQRVVYYSDWKIDSKNFKAEEARRVLNDTKFKQYGREVGTEHGLSAMKPDKSDPGVPEKR